MLQLSWRGRAHDGTNETAISGMQDNVVQLEDIIPPLRDLSTAALYELALQPLIPVEVLGDRQYYMSLRHGILTDKTRLIHLLEGKTTELTAL